MDLLKRFFGKQTDASDDAGVDAPQHDIRVAACALFLEMANIDSEFKGAESEHVVELMRTEFGLADEHAQELLRVAKAELDGSIDLWRFTNRINKNYSKEEKLQIVEMIWKVVYEDGHLSDHENYLVKKLGHMLRITHRELIQAKLNVLHGG